MSLVIQTQDERKPILLFDDECGVCRRIANWVRGAAQDKSGKSSLVVRPIGNDPELLRSLNPALDIWEAYATIHVLMPDGSMKLGGEAVAVVLRNLSNTQWFTWTFTVSVFGFRPFQTVLNLAYAVLADVRPLFGCESCGAPNLWVRTIWLPIKWLRGIFGKIENSSPRPHFRPHRAKGLHDLAASGEGRRQAPHF
jgi:predicted DCC family thiol-disulfide oxidoreductase YuxK